MLLDEAPQVARDLPLDLPRDLPLEELGGVAQWPDVWMLPACAFVCVAGTYVARCTPDQNDQKTLQRMKR